VVFIQRQPLLHGIESELVEVQIAFQLLSKQRVDLKLPIEVGLVRMLESFFELRHCRVISQDWHRLIDLRGRSRISSLAE
jgi:hypothetical protein